MKGDTSETNRAALAYYFFLSLGNLAVLGTGGSSRSNQQVSRIDKFQGSISAVLRLQFR
jgi:hypothetical protein